MDPLEAHSASFVYRAAPDAVSAQQVSNDAEPPRKKMRKGTKSCVECRRRKTRCTSSPSRPGCCNECFMRGIACIDQEHAPFVLDKSQPRTTMDQPYSLRERVAVLESTVEAIMKRLGESEVNNAHNAMDRSRRDSDSHGLQASCSPMAPESPAGQTEQAPLLALFDNHLVSRSKSSIEHFDDHSSENHSPKNKALRSRLLSLLPPLPDIQRILQTLPHMYILMRDKYSEFHAENLPLLLADGADSLKPKVLGNLAKLLIYLVIIIDQLSTSFDFRNLQIPLSPKDFIDRVMPVVDSMTNVNEDIASTFPGIECFYLAAKYHINAGRPRKAWRLCRRGIEFAQLRGLHLSPNRPIQPGDKMGLRQSYTWCSLACLDRYLSLVLGLPYAVADRFVVPQLAHLASTGYLEPSEEYIYRLCNFAGRIVDRNQDPSDSSLSQTLILEQELAELSDHILRGVAGTELSKPSDQTLMVQFMYNFIRLMLHLPFVLNSNADARSQFCRYVAVESSRNCIQIYRTIREETEFETAVCKLVDFQMFTAAMLLGNSFRGNPDLPGYIAHDKAADRQLLEEAIRIFRDVSNDQGGSVAAQSASILEMLLGRCPQRAYGNDHGNGCKITIPYFGTIYLRPGKKSQKTEACYREHPSRSTKKSSPPQAIPNPYITPSVFTPVSVVTPTESAITGSSVPLDDQVVSLENILALPNIDFDVDKMNNGNMDMNGWQADPNLDLDLCLDQGWNLDWFDL